MSGQQQSQNVSQQQQQQVPEKFLKPFYKLSVAQLNEAWKVNPEIYVTANVRSQLMYTLAS